MLESNDTPKTLYHSRLDRFGALRDREQRRSDINGNASLVLVLLAVALFGVWLWQPGPLLLTSACVFALGFAISFIHHGDVNRALRRARELVAINDEGLRRLRRDWDGIPLHNPASADPAHPYAADLDLAGRASLEHLLHTPATPVGRATLRAWLLAPADAQTIGARQAAVAELAPLVDLRDDVALRGRLMQNTQPTYERFLAWAETPPWLLPRTWLVLIARVLAVLALLLLAARLLDVSAGLPLALVLVANLLLYFRFARMIEARIEQVAEKQGVFEAYAELFARITAERFDAPELQRLQRELSAHDIQADAQMRRLARLIALAEVRKWMFFFPIQLATLWSFHVLWLLERWQRDAGIRARAWLNALGEFEALAALATLAFDNPTWIFPEPSDEPLLAARDLGHPLLPPASCVGNNVTIGPPGQLVLVTGSNMSGKSTLLRAIGVNVVLGQAGGPVCAAALQLPPLALVTSMRVQDSLEQGVSYFMAELRRLKFVVDCAHTTRAEGRRTLLFLLDEILHGTNSAERLIAARLVIRHLLDEQAMGVVSTHDLALGDTPALAGSTQVHFTEQFSRGPEGLSMHFDYQLRSGPATSTNALKLMELVGLPTPQSSQVSGETLHETRAPGHTDGLQSMPDRQEHRE